MIKRDQHLFPKDSDQEEGQGFYRDSSTGVGSATDLNAAPIALGQSILPTESSPFVFGRWFRGAWDGDQLSQPFKQASDGRKVTVGNRYYAVFRESLAPMNVPWGQSGKFKFKLTDGSVHFIENTPGWLSPKVSEGKLGIGSSFLHINLADQSVSTRIKMSHDQAGSTQLNVSGKINEQGMFTARGDSGMAAGALSGEGGHAAMLFEKTVEGGVFHGISTWSR
ncbi:MAG: hypothetical protein HOE45_05440 [Gammaproteobacteria bacterium]|nr:hypothetical protein [Gammaproteobacteria bacterium]